MLECGEPPVKTLEFAETKFYWTEMDTIPWVNFTEIEKFFISQKV